MTRRLHQNNNKSIGTQKRCTWIALCHTLGVAVFVQRYALAIIDT